LGHCFCISKAEQKGIRLLAVDVNATATFNLSDMKPVSDASWANYVKGVFYYIQEYTNQPIDGFDCTFLGTIPMGSGLSSSAALEVSAAYAVLQAIGANIEKKEITTLCRQAEHTFAGTNCGLLDQFSSIFGAEHGLIHSDFRSMNVSTVDLADDIGFLVVNPKIEHKLSESPYNERRLSCETAATQMAERLPHCVSSLRDVSLEEFAAHRDEIDPEAAQRAAHVIGEIARVQTGVRALKEGDLPRFGKLLFESHQSSIDNFENSCPELDIIVDAARQAGALGARLSGGGFGGCAIVMTQTSQAEAIRQQIKASCESRGMSPEIISAIPSQGATVL
jgi:galactokinase